MKIFTVCTIESSSYIILPLRFKSFIKIKLLIFPLNSPSMYPAFISLSNIDKVIKVTANNIRDKMSLLFKMSLLLPHPVFLLLMLIPQSNFLMLLFLLLLLLLSLLLLSLLLFLLLLLTSILFHFSSPIAHGSLTKN